MARVLLVSTNRERTPFPVMPVGPAIVAAHARAAGHEVRLIDLMFERDVAGALRSAVAAFRPEAAGVSMRNVDNSDLVDTKFHVPDVEETLRLLRREAPGLPVVLGGAATSIEPRALLALWGPGGSALAPGEPPLVDVLLAGDAEERFPRLLDRVLSGRPVSDLPGVCARGEDGAVSFHAAGLSEPLDGLLEARLFDHVDVARYARADGVYPVQTRRGCAFTCTYCTYGSIEGTRLRLRPPSDVADEVERALGAGVTRFEFVDAVFSHPAAHARAVLEELLARGLSRRVELSASGLNPAGVSEDLVRLMRRAGFTSVSATVESASTAMLRRMRKGFDAEEVDRLAGWLPKHGIPAVWIFLVGSPGETPGTVEETFDFVARRVPPRDLAYVTSGVRVYRGTGLHRELLSSGLLDEGQDLLPPLFAFSASLPREAYLERLLALSSRHPNVVSSFEAGQPVVERLARLLGRLPLPRPRWRLLPLVRRFGSPFRRARADALTSAPWPVVLA